MVRANSADEDFRARTRRPSGDRARPYLLSNLLDEGLRTGAVAPFVVDDFPNELGLRVVRTARAVAHFGGELPTFERGRPRLFLCHSDGIRLPVMGRLGLRDVVKARRLGGPLSGTVTARAGRGEAERVADAPVPSANATSFSSHATTFPTYRFFSRLEHRRKCPSAPDHSSQGAFSPRAAVSLGKSEIALSCPPEGSSGRRSPSSTTGCSQGDCISTRALQWLRPRPIASVIGVRSSSHWR